MMNNIMMEEDGGYRRRRRLSERQEPHQEKQRGQSYLDETSTSSSSHSSDYGAPKLGHPTSYDDDPPFKGPLTLSRTVADSSFDNNRVRIRHYYDNQYDEQQRSLQLDGNNNVDNSSPLTTTKKIVLGPSTPTNVILKAIVDHLAYRDAPVDVKEVAESIEFYLRCGKRLLGAARRTTGTILRDDDHDSICDGSDDDNNDDHNDMRNDMFNNHQQNIINVQDLCSGHGLTGMIFLACNPPGRIIDIDGNSIMITSTCIDIVEPKSHNVLRGMIAEICPWVGVDGAVSFITSSLEEYATAVTAARQEQQQRQRRYGATTMETIVISTHACGSLTDKVLHYASTINASSIAVMPCCYTGTADGAPYGIKRMLGVSLAADIRRSFVLQECGAYHVDFASIPKSITPMNRIIVAERRK
jgi:hypothetical protein